MGILSFKWLRIPYVHTSICLIFARKEFISMWFETLVGGFLISPCVPGFAASTSSLSSSAAFSLRIQNPYDTQGYCM